MAAISRVESAATRVPGTALVRDQGVSSDGQARKALVVGSASVGQGNAGDPSLVKAIRATFSHADAPAGLAFHLTGPLAQASDAQTANATNGSSIRTFTLLFVIVLLFGVFRALLAPLASLHARFGPAQALPAAPPPGTSVPARTWRAYRATAQYISPDGRTVQFSALLAAGSPASRATIAAIPALRAPSSPRPAPRARSAAASPGKTPPPTTTGRQCDPGDTVVGNIETCRCAEHDRLPR